MKNLQIESEALILSTRNSLIEIPTYDQSDTDQSQSDIEHIVDTKKHIKSIKPM